MGIPALCQTLLENGIQSHLQSASSYYHAWHSTFKGIKEYHKKVMELYKNQQQGNVFETYKEEFQLKKLYNFSRWL